jgi:pRiA4b ORF-3-like protein
VAQVDRIWAAPATPMTDSRPRSRRIGSRARGASQRLSRPRPDQWISIQVELVEGRGERYWPRAGRIFAAATVHSFAQLATAIDVAFARWDRSHLHEFQLDDGTRIGIVDDESDIDDSVVDEQNLKLARLKPGEQFVYVFDFGDDWAHLCTVGESPIDPVETVGLAPETPLPYFGWGAIPDQYGRAWSADDGDTPLPADPGLGDLPPLRPDWGPGRQS